MPQFDRNGVKCLLVYEVFMRIDLTVPYDQKDKAKSLGARWDSDKRTWYVVDPERIGDFSMWMGEAAAFMKRHKRLFKETNRRKTHW